MLELLLWSFVGYASFVSIHDWRKGLAFCAIAAAVQDPIRKVIDGTPPYLSVAFIPIFLSIVAGLYLERPTPLRGFFRAYPYLKPPIALFAASLFISFLQTMSYGFSALPIGLIGLFSYAALFPSVLLGYYYAKQSVLEVESFLFAALATTSLMLLGVPLEYYGVEFDLPWLGTVGMTRDWVRWYAEGAWIRMISGFYRSPEIMGWHAMFLVALCLYMLLQYRRWPAFWIGLGIWGSYGMLLSGRRKMFLTVVAFGGFLLLTVTRERRGWLLKYSIGILIFAIPIVLLFVDSGYLQTARTGLTDAGLKATEKGMLGPVYTLTRVGLFGYGLGTKSQGAQHFDLPDNIPQLEGGFEKVLIETGLVGVISAVFVLFAVATAVLNSKRASTHHPRESLPNAIWYSWICANAASFVVSFQVFGDPYILILTGFFTGLVLSSRRIGARTTCNNLHSNLLVLRRQGCSVAQTL